MVKSKKKEALDKTWVNYLLDLRQEHDWSGEIDFTARHLGRGKDAVFSTDSHAQIQILGPLAYTGSSKVEIGVAVELTISIRQHVEDSEFIGIISKNSEGLYAHVFMPWNEAMFFHQVLMSGKCELLEITGTELYRCQGWVRRVGLNRKYEFDE